MPLLLGRAAVDDVTSQIAAWSRRARSVRLARLAATRDELPAMIRGVDAPALSRRPAPKAWAAVEIVCHVRDLEESFHERIALIVVADEPRFPTTHPDRWALERQYLRHDADAAAAAFVAWRGETLALFERLASEDWERAGYQVDSRGRRTIDGFLTVMAWHDENHLAQLARALAGRP